MIYDKLPSILKYWPPSTSWRFMSEFAHDNWQRLKLFRGFIHYYLMEETATLNVSTECMWLITMGCGSQFHLNNLRRKNDSCPCWVLQGGLMKDEGCIVRNCLKRAYVCLFFSNNHIFVCYFVYIMSSRASLHLSSRLPVQVVWHFTNTRCVSLSVGSKNCSHALGHFELMEISPSLLEIAIKTVDLWQYLLALTRLQ